MILPARRDEYEIFGAAAKKRSVMLPRAVARSPVRGSRSQTRLARTQNET
jgi:hypothetical protein